MFSKFMKSENYIKNSLLCRKYERTKQVVDTLRRNEETLRGAITDYESKLQKQEQKFIEFQKHAEEKIQL